jgi:hypothetical protein
MERKPLLREFDRLAFLGGCRGNILIQAHTDLGAFGQDDLSRATQQRHEGKSSNL